MGCISSKWQSSELMCWKPGKMGKSKDVRDSDEGQIVTLDHKCDLWRPFKEISLKFRVSFLKFRHAGEKRYIIVC